MARGELWQRLAAGAWLAMILGALAIGAFGTAEQRAWASEDGPGCPFRTATSLECAFCGMTHATIALGHGDLRAAFAYHPLAPIVLLLMIVACGAIVLGRGRWLGRGKAPAIVLAVIAAIWIANLIW